MISESTYNTIPGGYLSMIRIVKLKVFGFIVPELTVYIHNPNVYQTMRKYWYRLCYTWNTSSNNIFENILLFPPLELSIWRQLQWQREEVMWITLYLDKVGLKYLELRFSGFTNCDLEITCVFNVHQWEEARTTVLWALDMATTA